MLESLHHTWAGGFLVHIVTAGSWVVSPFFAIGFSVGMAPRTYGVSLLVGGVAALSSLSLRRLLACSTIAFEAYMAPLSVASAGGALSFSMYWCSFVGKVISMCGLYFYTFPRSPAFKKLLRDLDYTKYYSGGCELKGALEDIRKEGSLFGFHPHGVLCTGFSWNACWSKQFAELAGEDTLYMIDKVLREDGIFFKIICDLHGCVSALTKGSLLKALGAKRNVCFIPGGFEDAAVAEFDTHVTVIAKRTGFIKYALQNGCRVHACYTFGETKAFYTWTGMRALRLRLCAKGIPAVVFFGLPFAPLFPRTDIKVATYISKAIQLPKIENPTKEEVEKWHKCYCDALTEVFEKNKREAGVADDVHLAII